MIGSGAVAGSNAAFGAALLTRRRQEPELLPITTGDTG